MTEVETELLKTYSLTRNRCMVTGLNLAIAGDPVEVGKGLFIDRDSVRDREFQKAARDASRIDRLKLNIRGDLELRAIHIQSYRQLEADGGSLDLNWLDDQVSELTNDVEEDYRELKALTVIYGIKIEERFEKYVKTSLRERIE